MDIRFDIDEVSVHLWAFTIEPTHEAASTFLPFLSADEKVRASHFKFAHLSHAYIVCRGLVRVLLGRYLESDPGCIEIQYRSKQKPYVANLKDIDFNISHTSGMMLCAVARGCEIGVDVEKLRHFPNMRELAGRFFCSEEADELMSLPKAQRTEAFYRCWTRKEAYIKAIGAGLSESLDSFRVTLKSAEEASFIHIRGDAALARNWKLLGLEIDRDYLGALAYPGPKRRVRMIRSMDRAYLMENSFIPTRSRLLPS